MQYQIDGTDLKKIQSEQTKILRAFDQICRDNDLRYSIEGGTLMGAYKFKGFVPWDDDIDVVMPRADYEKFLVVASKIKNGFSVHTYKNNKYHILNYCKYRMDGTIYKEKLNQHLDMNHGLFIDIFPLDEVNLDKYQSQARLISFFYKIRWYKLGYRKKNLLFSLIFSLLPNRLLVKIIDKIIKSQNDKGNAYLYEICNYNPKFKPIPKEWFDDLVDIEYEGILVKAVSKYQEYLNARFSDLSSLPPENERVPSHQIVEVKLRCK